MRNSLISVIIPVYNVEQYLCACVDSVLNQTYRNLEIILIDDGSSDGSAQIADRYAETDSRVYVVHQKNGGLSVARNAGLQIAGGEYITFVDSDDCISEKYIEKLYALVRKYDADVSICDYIRFTEDTPFAETDTSADEMLFSNTECIKQMYQPKRHGMEFTSWAKLYRTKLFSENKIMFPVGKLHEDTFTTYRVLYYAGRIVFTDIALYGYRTRADSIMTSSFSLRRCDSLEANAQACQFFLDAGEEELLRYALNAYMRSGRKICRKIQTQYHGKDKKEQLHSLCAKCSQSLKKYGSTAKYSWNRRIYYTLWFAVSGRKYDHSSE